MDHELRMQRMAEMQQLQTKIALTLIEQGIASAIMTDQPEYANKGQAQLPENHPWKQQLPSKEKVNEWAVACATAAYERERAKWPDERIRQFAKEVQDGQK